ncbi:uncharacterized protein EI97DRAFT_374899 [Westerdykella ornata]|uniref:BZIP domain-containing protein n=1 Tax=Westerdykella ornata TaxID=318751 RepID=A0A6A6JLM6_WESOR|nr:uncharacterized protein EI97DRAFT_374899 [Westerdykella ornata]KAF2277491.1 hypothetical protein EI97DRAFT_374899 [Westerdykella ornata]
MGPTYPPSGTAADYPSPASRRPSDCISEMSMPASRRGSAANFVIDQESHGQWHTQVSDSKSPLANFPFFINLTEKKTTRDGQPPKRRGPKPDSKPALTRRQELNRQAQRTHRERKEMYIKALEQEVLRLKEIFTNTSRERDSFSEENRRLRDVLLAHGISYDLASPSNHNGLSHVSSSYGGGSSRGSVSNGYGPGSNSTGYTSPPSQPRGSISGHAAHPSLSTPLPQQQQPQPQPQPHLQQQQPNPGLDYDQLGIDFVLTLEQPCKDHVQFLMEQRHLICGHALMATCPPQSHVLAHPDVPYPHRMPDISVPDLMKLLNLSSQLPLEGELTPVQAWAMILRDPRVRECGLGTAEVEMLKGELVGKVRCYGFGAVLEEFEVRDALMTVFAGRSSSAVGV